MVEAAVPVLVAAATGLSILFTRINRRVTVLDRRVDVFELRVAQEYVPKTDISQIVDRMEKHMIRIENKIDKIISK